MYIHVCRYLRGGLPLNLLRVYSISETLGRTLLLIVYIYIYTYRERERENIYYVYVYIYILCIHINATNNDVILIM